MCEGNYVRDPYFVASHQERFKRSTTAYSLRDRYRRISGKNCVYFGFKAETGDHVPSLFAGYTDGTVNGVIVPVCTDRNRALGPFASTCFNERLELVALVSEQLAEKNQTWANNPKAAPPVAREGRKFREKLDRCREKQAAIENDDCQILNWK